MKFTNKIYRNGEHINTVTTTNKDAIIKELINCLTCYKEKAIYDSVKDTLIVRHAFTHTTASGQELKYTYNIVFEDINS